MISSDRLHTACLDINKTRYMPGLDGLRAISVLAVIAYHLDCSWAPGGFLGVGIFFVLSGYLITDQLLDQWRNHQRFELKDFWIRRAKRLLPALLLMLAVISVILVVFDRSRLASFQGDLLSVVFYINNWWLIFHHVSYFESFGPASPLGHLWSLAIEEQFYLVWPLILAVLTRWIPKRSKLAAVTLAGAAVSMAAMALLYTPGTDPSRVYYGTDTRAFALLIGAALAMIWPSKKLPAMVSDHSRLTLDIVGAVCLLIIVIAIWKTSEYGSFLYLGGMGLFSIVAAVLTAVLAHPASRISGLIGSEPLRWIGVRSYGLYLWHFPVIILTSPSVSVTGSALVLTVAQLVLTFSLAAFSWEYIEKPIRRGSLTGMLNRTRIAAPLELRYILILIMLPLVSFFFSGPISLAEEKAYTNQTPSIGEVTTDPALQVENSQPPSVTTEAPGQTVPVEKPPAVTEPIAGPKVVTDKLVTVIGDSVILGAAPYLKKSFPSMVIDGKLGRQMNDAQLVVDQLKKNGKIGSCVIIELGSNGPFNMDKFKKLLASLKNADQIIIVNTRVPRKWQNTVNADLAKAVAKCPKATLVDWYSASKGKADLFYQDGVHLNPKGARYYASLINSAVKVKHETVPASPEQTGITPEKPVSVGSGDK